MSAEFHFPENAFALHLFFECAQGLIDVVVADNNMHVNFPFLSAGRQIPLGGPLLTTSYEAHKIRFPNGIRLESGRNIVPSANPV